MAGFSRFPAIPASPDLGLLNRLLLRAAPSFVVGFFLALPFPLFGAGGTELAPRQTFAATGTAGNFLLRYGLPYPCRPSEAERLEQVKVVLWVLMPEPVRLHRFAGPGVQSVDASPYRRCYRWRSDEIMRGQNRAGQ
jgi:hypothetical protein